MRDAHVAVNAAYLALRDLGWPLEDYLGHCSGDNAVLCARLHSLHFDLVAEISRVASYAQELCSEEDKQPSVVGGLRSLVFPNSSAPAQCDGSDTSDSS